MNNALHVFHLVKFPVVFYIAIYITETKGIAMFLLQILCYLNSCQNRLMQYISVVNLMV